VTLPIYQRKGYGFFLISFSYLLSQRENRLGSPEKPLSDLGLLSYRSYWKTALASTLLKVLDAGANISIQGLGRRTGMTDDDVVSGLEGLDALVRDPQTGIYAIKVNKDKLTERVNLVETKGYVKVKEDLLKWAPYLLGRKEAKDLLDGGLDDLIRRRDEIVSDTFSNIDNSAPADQQPEGRDIPAERFLSVAVRDTIQPLQHLSYESDVRTPMSAGTAGTPKPSSPSPSIAEDEDEDEEEESLSSPSIAEDDDDDDISDEPFSDADLEEPSEDEMSDYLSDDSNDFSSRKRMRVNRSSRHSSRATPDLVVRLKQISKAPRNRTAFANDADGKPKPRVIAAKAPRSRAGHNPPEVMSRRATLRRM